MDDNSNSEDQDQEFVVNEGGEEEAAPEEAGQGGEPSGGEADQGKETGEAQEPSEEGSEAEGSEGEDSGEGEDLDEEEANLVAKMLGPIKKVRKKSRELIVKGKENAGEMKPFQKLASKALIPILALKKFLNKFDLIWKSPFIIFNLLKSPDPREKILAMGFLFGFALLSAAGVRFFLSIQDKLDFTAEEQKQSQIKSQLRDKLMHKGIAMDKLLEKRFGSAEDHRRLKFGPLTLVAKSDRFPRLSGVNIEIHLLLDNPQSAKFFEKNLSQAQDAIITALEPLDFDKSNNREGRKVVKKKIMDALNRLGRKNTVEDIFFATFLGS